MPAYITWISRHGHGSSGNIRVLLTSVTYKLRMESIKFGLQRLDLVLEIRYYAHATIYRVCNPCICLVHEAICCIRPLALWYLHKHF
eukprot:Gb_20399 [translate_table: standard]